MLHSLDNSPNFPLNCEEPVWAEKGSLFRLPFQASGGKCSGNLHHALFQRKTLVTGHETQQGEGGNGNNLRKGKTKRLESTMITYEGSAGWFFSSPTDFLASSPSPASGWAMGC